MPIAMLSPQVLSAGHGALHADLAIGASIGVHRGVLLAKSAASVVSLGFGFRGGLFFASLFLGTLIGHLFAGILAMAVGHPVVDPPNAALVGMAALAVAVVGGPMTMAMLVLEATSDFALTGAVIAAGLVSVDDRARAVRLLLLDLAAAPARRDDQERARRRLGAHADRGAR